MQCSILTYFYKCFLFLPSFTLHSETITLFDIFFTMRSTIIVSAFAALALAAPRPQDIEWDQVDSAADPEIFTPPTDVTVDTVAIQPASAASAVASAAVTDIASTTSQKRDMLEVAELLSARNAECTLETPGTGTAISK